MSSRSVGRSAVSSCARSATRRASCWLSWWTTSGVQQPLHASGLLVEGAAADPLAARGEQPGEVRPRAVDAVVEGRLVGGDPEVLGGGVHAGGGDDGAQVGEEG